MTKLLTILALAGLLVASNPMLAHHSGAGSEETPTTLTGTVTKFELINPHVLIHFEAKDDKGTVQQWIAQGGSLTGLRRDKQVSPFWNSKTLRPGDQITITAHRYKDGRNIMSGIAKIVANGKELPSPEPRSLGEGRLNRAPGR